MPVQKFLEVDSTYRNRNLYPGTGEFTINISQGNAKTQITASDPVSEAYPDIIFKPDDITCTKSPHTLNGLKFTFEVASGELIAPHPFDSSSATNEILLSYDFSGVGASPLAPNMLVDDYFVGLVLLYSQGKTQLMRRITKWKFLDVDMINKLQYFVAVLEQNITDFLTNTTTTFTVYNPSTIPPIGAFLFIPASVPVDNFYNGYIIWNMTTNTYSVIDEYNGKTHIAHVGGKTENLTSWGLDDVFVVRKKPPVIFSGSLNGVLSGFPNSVKLQTTSSPNMINSFLWMESSPADQTRYIKRIVSIIGLDKGGNHTTDLNRMVSFTDYVNLENTLGLPDGYDMYFYQLLQYSADISVPFAYSGTMISNSQSSAQELTLNTLILPNVILSNGGKIWQYPYVYVEVENVSTSSSGNRNVIYSNNPNSYKAVFKVPITNISNPDTYSFLNLSGNGVKQIVNFKQNADVKITIRMPNGTVFQTFTGDNTNGQYPNPFLQITALFGMEKI
jgi:hypothetical protein